MRKRGENKGKARRCSIKKKKMARYEFGGEKKRRLSKSNKDE
jgi:hypothetical protein